MPNRVIIKKVIGLNYDIYFKDLNRFIGLAYPGMYLGLSDTRSGALQMAQLRYEVGRRKFFEKNADATERDWETYTADREVKFKEVYKTKGVSDESCWSTENVDKT